jgi:hypothetical protein
MKNLVNKSAANLEQMGKDISIIDSNIASLESLKI